MNLASGITRREALRGGAALAALAFMRWPVSALEFASDSERAEVIAFADQLKASPRLRWDEVSEWITPSEKLFAVSHYGTASVEPESFRLEIGGLVKRPKSLTLDDIKARRKKTIVATLECSGNGSSPGFMCAIGNSRWSGTPLAPLLRECGISGRAIEAVFYGADEKIEKIRDKEYLQNFARSLSLRNAFADDVLLAYEMNGEPLTKEHGAPLRLVVPGWFGIAWVKWLSRIELLDRRFMSKYMAREYVTIRGEEKDGRTIWRETSVGPMNVKSMVARALRLKNGTIRFVGLAWTDGTPLETVEVKIDDGPWQKATIDKKHVSRHAWRFWTFDWTKPATGEHRVVSRATDAEGRTQPSPEDPDIKLKRTYWEANQQWPRKIQV